MAGSDCTIAFAKPGDEARVSDGSRAVIRRIMARAGVSSLKVTSTARDALEQARAMFDNLEAKGVAEQMRLYAAAGRAVIEVYVASKAAGRGGAAIIDDMRSKIVAIGPGKVSRHCADFTKLQVIDIAPSSIARSRRRAWEDALQAEAAVSQFFMPPDDPAYHLEIPQPAQ